MSRNRNERQFDEYRDWQWCKHLTLGDYIVPWSMKVGSTTSEIFVVDAFAGAGSYTDPATGKRISDGSPVIFARRAQKYSEERPGRTMRVVCVEKNRNNFEALEQRMKGFGDLVVTRRGDFAGHVPEIIEMLDAAPALILLDPIGLKTIAAEAWRPFLEREGKTDLFIVLHFAVVHRTGGMLLPSAHANPALTTAVATAAMLDGVFNGPRWRFIAVDPKLQGDKHRAEREERYIDLYFEDVIGDRHRYKCAFPVRAGFESPVKYWLVHASDKLDAFLLMNDEIVKLDELLFTRTYRHEDEIEGFVETELDARRAATMRDLEDAIFEAVAIAPGRRLSFRDLRDGLLRRFFGRVKTGAYAKAVRALVKDGRVTREAALVRAKFEDGEIITLADRNAHMAGGSAVVIPFRAPAA